MTRLFLMTMAVILGGWLTFDGSRALVTGSDTTPDTSPYADQFGPWAAVVSSIGLDPTGTMLKAVHVVLGIGWLWCALLVLRQAPLARRALLLTALFSLWYLPVGTLVGLLVIGLAWRWPPWPQG